jgi:hypothetical protein
MIYSWLGASRANTASRARRGTKDRNSDRSGKEFLILSLSHYIESVSVKETRLSS